MKIRTGFVSNSSSSSFVVAFPKRPKSKKELQIMLFGKKSLNKPDNLYHNAWPIQEVVATVWKDLTGQISNYAKNIKQVMSSGNLINISYPWERLEKLDQDSIEYKTIYHDFEKEYDKLVENYYDNFMKKNKGRAIFCFEYSDNNGSYFSALEHGRLFHRLPHVQISKH